MIKRLFDLALAIPAALVLLMPVASVALAVRLTSPGPALYWSDRVGRHNKIFKMPKFRSTLGHACGGDAFAGQPDRTLDTDWQFFA